MIVGRGVSGSPRTYYERMCLNPGPSEDKKKKCSQRIKKGFVCNHLAVIVLQSAFLICHNMFCHLLTSVIHPYREVSTLGCTLFGLQ